MDKEQIKLLIPKYLAGDCSEEESALVESWYNQYPEDPEMDVNEMLILKSTNRIHNRLNSLLEPKSKKLFRRLSVAASILLATAVAGYLFTGYLHREQQAALLANKIMPGRHGAMLTLANGRKIKLSDTTNGELAKESGLIISKAANGQLVYQITTKNTSLAAGAYNTLSTSNGEIFQVLLPDSSKIWLNAASALTYPVSLATDNKRLVKLNGEAYFEVFKDKKHPFVVKTSRQEIEVLGTHFNISSYADERLTTTTLIEGLVKVRCLDPGAKLSVNNKKEDEAFLHPGQQSRVGTAGISIQSVDPEDAIAWKNGRFLFNDEPLENIMRKISRWYDVEVAYNNEDIKAEKFYGVINRFSSIDEVLKMLRLTNKVSFKIEGRKITVLTTKGQ